MQDRTRSESRIVTALFDNRADAEEAVAALSRAGISRNNIRLTPGSQSGDPHTSRPTGAPRHEEKGFWETLQDLFLPEEDRHTYAEGLRRGGYLVAVSQVSTADHPRVLDILDKEGTVNLDERSATWRAEGWRGYEAGDREGRTGAESIQWRKRNFASESAMSATARFGFGATSLRRRSKSRLICAKSTSTSSVGPSTGP